MIFGSVLNEEFQNKAHDNKKTIFDQIPTNSKNLVIIAHGWTGIEAGLVDFIPLQGDALVFRKNDANDLTLIAHLSPDMFVRMLEIKVDW